MSQTFGGEAPRRHRQTPHRAPTRYLLLIDAGGTRVARLFLHNFEQTAEFDAGAEEVALMTRGLVPEPGALGSEWERVLEGHSAEERAAAAVYRLDL